MNNSRQSGFGGESLSQAKIVSCALILLTFFCVAGAAAERDGRWAILISGASGDPDLRKLYLQELTDLHSVLRNSLRFPEDQIIVLSEDPAKSPGIMRHQSTREGLQAVCRELATRVRKEDLVFVFIEGHGTSDGKVYKLNLVGSPDPAAEQLASALYSIPAQHFIVVNATSCSGGSLPALSRKGGIVITSTKSGMERNKTQFGRLFVDSFKDNAADSDKNGRISIIEAFSYASRAVEEYYKREGNLQTEHPVLEDNGDAKAQAQPGPENGEGLLARVTFLDAGIPAGTMANLTPEQQKLAEEVRDLETQIDALKYAKSEMPEAEYEKKLEALLLRLAKINAQLPK